MGPYQYVTRYTEPPNRLVGSAAITKKRRHIVGNDYHQIVIAVRAGFSTGGGTKQVNLLRPIQLSKPVDDLGQYWIVGGWWSEGLRERFRHVYHPLIGLIRVNPCSSVASCVA